MSQQMFDIRTGILSPLPDPDRTGMDSIIRELQAGLFMQPLTVGLKAPDLNPIVPIIYIAPVAVQQFVPSPVTRFY
jgi:hypothetical protein